MSLVVLLLLPFLGSVVTLLLPTRARTVLAGWAGLVSLVAAAAVLQLFPAIRDGQVIREEIPWLPSLGLDLVIRMDGFAWMFSVLVTVIGALCRDSSRRLAVTMISSIPDASSAWGFDGGVPCPSCAQAGLATVSRSALEARSRLIFVDAI